jgi:2,3-bisphosphoglycerate-dependent phosphoglycerate mutase
MKTTLFLIRHGETDWNLQKRIQGHVDIPLNDTGLQQAKRVAERMRSEPITALYSSDLQRARHTAECIARHHGIEVQLDERLRERNYGLLEGLTREEIDQQFPNYQASNHAVPGQEPLESVRQRALKFLSHIASQHPGERVAVVSHGGWINAVLHVLSKGRAGTGVTRLGNTSITTLICHGESWEIVSIGEMNHLDPERIPTQLTQNPLSL